MAKTSKIILYLVAIASLALFTQCANQLSPGGGAIDTVPPQIIESFPTNGTVNYNDNYFEITFSKYVEKRTVQDAIFISPALKKTVKYDWSGKTLTVTFNDTLKKNTTYTISIGTDVKDINNGNKMAESFLLAFSTGNKIDLGKISGKVYDQNSEGVMIFAFKENGKEFNTETQKPDYISQVGKNGNYALQGMGEGNYNVIAIRDKFRDYKYQKNEDEYGVQFKNINLNEKLENITDVNFFMMMEDTIAPKVKNVFMKDKNHIFVQFTKGIDSTKILPSNYYLIDSATNKKVFPKYFYKGEAKPNQYIIGLTDSLENKDSWMLVTKNVVDLKGNITALEKTRFAIKEERDTLSLKLNRILGKLPEGRIDYEKPELILVFNNVIDSTTIKEKLIIQDSKEEKLPFEIKRDDDATFIVYLLSKLKQSNEYTLKLDLKNYRDVFGNKVDSLFKQKFITSNDLDFSGASGIVSSSSDSSDIVVTLQNIAQTKTQYEQNIGKKKKFDLKKVVPGKYLLWGFKDKNANRKYDHGLMKPYTYSEEFKFYSDTLNLRARWPVGDINLSFDKN
jgi:hypothetical protein